MEKWGYIQFLENEEEIRFWGRFEPPKLTRETIPINFGYGQTLYTMGRTEWGKLEIEICDDITGNGFKFLQNWLYRQFSSDFQLPQKKQISLIEIDMNGFTISKWVVCGAIVSKFNLSFIDIYEYESFFKNDPFLTREVLIEKKGNFQKFKSKMTIELNIDRAVLDV